MITVAPVRHGVPTTGAVEAVAEAGGLGILIGSGTDQAVETFRGVARSLSLREAAAFRPTAWADHLASAVAAHDVVIVPMSRDGADLAPRIAIALERPLLPNVVEVGQERIVATRLNGGLADVYERTVPVVVLFKPGSRGVVRDPLMTVKIDRRSIEPTGVLADPVLVDDVPPDSRMVLLTEADRVVAAGAGVEDEEGVGLTDRLAAVLGAGVGATRVVVDRGWLPFDRQIGTTGAMVDPDLYMAFGISGATQHLSGIGDPRHVISINTDPSCAMMLRANVAVVCDARSTLRSLLQMLEP
ncbi:MAG: electron transfer flavoprotein subunit alpha/FixB family protein [Actinobacteria bacterium]|nr:electron transfer flavoprotein subunit alpha/FixB family protein [Actinomycetota bacterium]